MVSLTTVKETSCFLAQDVLIGLFGGVELNNAGPLEFDRCLRAVFVVTRCLRNVLNNLLMPIDSQDTEL